MEYQARSCTATGNKDVIGTITKCRYCEQIQLNSKRNIVVLCTKLSGSPHPIYVNMNTCLSCPEFHRLGSHAGRAGPNADP